MAIIFIIISGLLSALGAIFGNIAATMPLPPIVTPYLRFTWLAFAVVTVLGISLAIFWHYHQQKDIESPIPSQESQNRQRMLERVHIRWIAGVLEQSLHGAALVVLGLQEQRDAVTNPWHLVFQQPNQPPRPLSPGTRITQVYDDAGGELLILGEPGSGKTTLLLELARDLLDRAKTDEKQPMPLVFNLSSWAVKRGSITNWLVDELNNKYQVPRKLGQAWIDADQILPLLDGLDEVRSEYRTQCVNAINTYRREHMTPIVVCSRKVEYLAQVGRVLLHNAVVIQPLTVRQIDDYLSSAGEQLEALHVAFCDDPVLRELATTPLMLSILTLTYHGRSPKDLSLSGSVTTQRRQIFATYVQRMLQRRGIETRYTPQQTIDWLVWLAQRMRQQSQTVFYIERMQPDWLADGWLRRLFRIVAFVLLGTLLAGLTIGPSYMLVYGLLHGLSLGVVYGIVFGGITGLAFGVIFGLLSREEIEIRPIEIVTWSWVNIWQSLVKIKVLLIALLSSIFIGLSTGLLVGLLSGLNSGLYFGVLVGLLTMLLNMAIGVLRGGLKSEMLDENNLTKPNQGTRYSVLNSMRSGLLGGIYITVLAVLLAGLLSGMIREWHILLINKLLNVPSNGLLMGLVYGSLMGVLCGLYDRQGGNFFSSSIRPQYDLLHTELLFGIFVGLLTTYAIGMFIALVNGLGDGPTTWLFAGLLLGPGFAIFIAVFNGGLASIKHICLRWLLWYAGYGPLNYPRFLDYAADRILLRKVGGGYIFIHRLLLDYFASLNIASSLHKKTT